MPSIMPAILSVCSTSTEPSGPTASSTRSARCSPSRSRDPFAPEVVVRADARDGALADAARLRPARRSAPTSDFPPPRALVGDAIAAAAGDRARRRPVAARADGVAAARGRRRVARRAVGGGARRAPRRRGRLPAVPARARRLGSVRHLAELFDRYALHRPELVLAWAAGGLGGRLAGGAVAAPARADRRARPGRAARAGVRAAARRAGAARPAAAALAVRPHAAARRPPRRSCARSPPGATSTSSCCTPRPRCGSGSPASPPVVRRREDPTATLRREPPARLLGPRRARAAARARPGRRARRPPPSRRARRRHRCSRASRPTCAPTGGRAARDDRPVLDPGDRSVQVHACHGRARQVEVLRDAILHLLAEDPALEPRDVIVMCPDIETFAPLIQATFGAGEAVVDEDEPERGGDRGVPPDLRVRLADRSLRQTNPVLGAVARLLDLADQRLTASQVLDLADREPVRRRFRLDDDDLVRLEDWVAAAGIRWGLDAQHRAPFKLGNLPAGTWRFGLDRVLVGVTMTEDERRLFAGVLPLDDVDSGAIDLAGRFAELVDRLEEALERAEPRAADRRLGGRDRRRRRRVLRDRAGRDAWQRAELQRLLDDVVAEATDGGAVQDTPLALPEVRDLLAERLAGRPTRANFRTGHLTICTLVPMRSVPHRVVCLLGLDDAAFPRRSPRDGDDRLLDEPHVGERDARAEDRQMLLDALMAATDRLVDHLHRQRRAHEPRAPARGPRRRAARRRRPHRPRRRRRRAREQVVVRHPAAAVRRPQLHAGRARPRPAVELRPRHARRRPGARRRAHARPARSSPARSPAARRRCSRSRTSSASPAIPCARSCASGSGSASPSTTTRSRTPCRSSSTRSRSGGSASGCSRRGWPGTERAHRRARRDRARQPAAGRARQAGGRPRACRSWRPSSPWPARATGRRST